MAEGGEEPKAPKLARRKDHKKSTWKSGRTIGERREKLETASERALNHKKNEKRKRIRFVATLIGFATVMVVAVWAYNYFIKGAEPEEYSPVVEIPFVPTVEVIDESPSSSGITSRMKEYIGQAEADFRELGYTPVKVVIPKGTIREVDFYLDGKTGHIKLFIDRPTGVSVEDADRMLRYLEEQGINEFTYIDVRIDSKAYWK